MSDRHGTGPEARPATSPTNILAPANRDLLRRLAGGDSLLAFDYDGTLAPLVADPAQAWMRRTTQDLLTRVANAYACVVVSGRSSADISRRVDAAGIFEVLSSGAPLADEGHAGRVRSWARLLERRLVAMPGVTVEDKRFSLAIHYRHSPDRKAACRAIRRAVDELEGARSIHGKCVINVAPRDAPDKGLALQTAREQFGSPLALYVGDDATDEDVFALGDPERLLTVRVRAKRGSRAAYYIPDQRSIDELLATLLSFREESWRSD
jgi:trehalose 6-phosphate phosphatase